MIRMLEALPMPAYACDADGLLTYFNSKVAELWGREPGLNHAPDRFCGAFKLLGADGVVIPHERCWMALAIRSGLAYNGHEITIERPDGGRVTVIVHVNPIHEGDKIAGAVNILVDITRRKLIEEELKASESRLFLAEREARLHVEALSDFAQDIAGELDLMELAESIADSGPALVGAQFCTFVHDSSIDPALRGEGVVRSGDLTKDLRYAKSPPHVVTQGHVLKSYLAVPVPSRSGENLGRLFFEHAGAERFNERHARIAQHAAGLVAAAVENAQLVATLRNGGPPPALARAALAQGRG